jgi:hypothetical protein
MTGKPLIKKEEQNKSVNQTIYSEIRHLMDNAASNYKQKKEMEERNKIIREKLIQNRAQAARASETVPSETVPSETVPSETDASETDAKNIIISKEER